MTSVWQEDNLLPCTVVELLPCVVTQIKTPQKDGYEAIQIGYGEKKEKNTSKPLQGHFKKAKTSPKAGMVEFRNFSKEYKNNLSIGTALKVDDIFEEREQIDVVGKSKSKGFQGVVKRHGFSGVGERTHGQHNRQRAPGAIGACSTPSRVFKGMRMAGRTGGKRITVQNCEIIKILSDKNLLVLKGSVPGNNRSILILQK